MSKRIVKIFLFVLIIISSVNVFAEDVKIKITDIIIKDKSDYVTYTEPIVNDNNVDLNTNFIEKDDYITYELTVKNTDNLKWKIQNITDNNKLSNLRIDYDYSDNYIEKDGTSKIKIKLIYRDKLVNTESININNISITLDLISENGKQSSIIINNPTTGDGILKYFVLFTISIVALICRKTKKKYKKLKVGNFLVLIVIIMSPFMIFASEKITLNINVKNIILKSEMLSYDVTFNSNGGSKVNSKEVTYGDSVGELSNPIRSGYEFEGWYQDLDFTIPVTTDTIITDNITFYAKWSKVPFITFFSKDESISFEGKNYIDTGVHLNSEENHLKDYEVYFEIDKFDPDDQGNSNYMTFFSTKYETLDDVIVPGIAVRLNENRIEITQSLDSIAKTVSMEAAKVKSIKIVRKDGITYYSFNGNPLAELCNANTSIDKFDMPAIFGAAMTRDGQIFRNVNATLSNMYIKVGEYSDDDFYTIVFNPNGGTINSSQKLLNKNEKIGALPSASLVNYYNDGWYTDLSGGEKITSNTIPNDNVTYYAHWMKSLEAAELEDNELIFNVGTTKKINILNESEIEEEYTFTSSDKTVATVDNLGNVLGISEGETLITIKGKKSQKTKQVVVKINVGKSAIKFNTNGGYSLDSKVVSTNSEVGELPIPTRIFYKFEGWYKDSDFNEKVTTTTIVDNDVVYYAKWSKKELTTVFSQSGACTFNGKDGVIEGEECSNYAGEKYIDTGISLYNSENYN